MAFKAVVVQAPHYSFRNGGESADARQYFAGPTQRVENGPRIAPAIAGMVPGEFRSVWLDNAEGIFSVQRSDTNGTLDILDWTPHGVWHAATQQIIIGGRRRNLKFIAYAEAIGDWRQLPFNTTLGRAVAGTIHFYGAIATDGTRVFMGAPIGIPHTLDPATETWAALPEPPTTNGSNGASFSWGADSGRLVHYGGDAQVWRSINPGVDASWTTHATGLGNGQHALIRYHPTHQRHLLIGGSGTLRRAMLVTTAGVATLVTDCPGDVHMANGATSWVGAHPAGCFVVRGFNGTEHRVYLAWPNAGLTDVTWQDFGTAPDNGLTFPTLVPGYAPDLWLIVSTSGIHAWQLPTFGTFSIGVAESQDLALGLPELFSPAAALSNELGLALPLMFTPQVAADEHSAAALPLINVPGVAVDEAVAVSLAGVFEPAAAVEEAQALPLAVAFQPQVAVETGEALALSLIAAIGVAEELHEAVPLGQIHVPGIAQQTDAALSLWQDGPPAPTWFWFTSELPSPPVIRTLLS